MCREDLWKADASRALSPDGTDPLQQSGSETKGTAAGTALMLAVAKKRKEAILLKTSYFLSSRRT